MNHEGVVNPDGLKNWFVAVANRENVPANVIVGPADSIGEGVIAGDGSPTTGFLSTWRYQVQTRLQAAFPTAGVPTPGLGYVPALTVSGIPAVPVTTSGSPTAGTADHGLGMRRYRVNNTQYVQWDAQTCDRVLIWYGKTNSLGGGAIISIDGVDKTPQPSSSAGSVSDGYVWDSGALALGSHTVKVRGNSGFGFILEGCEFFNGDYGKGIHVYDAAHYGATTATYTAAATDTGHWQAVALAAPRLFIIPIGTNDWGTLDAATSLANVDTILSKCATAAGSRAYSVLLVGMYRPVRAANPDPAIWATYQAGLRARAVGNVAYLPVQPPWPDLYANTANSLMYELAAPLHPNYAGHTALADLIFQAIAPPRPTGPAGTYLPSTPKAVLP